jgi:hypothetical protein
MTDMIKWVCVAIGVIVILYSILIFAGVLAAPVYTKFNFYPIIMLFLGIAILFLSLGFFSAKSKD